MGVKRVYFYASVMPAAQPIFHTRSTVIAIHENILNALIRHQNLELTFNFIGFILFIVIKINICAHFQEFSWSQRIAVSDLTNSSTNRLFPALSPISRYGELLTSKLTPTISLGIGEQPWCSSSPICYTWQWWWLSPADLLQQITAAMLILSESSTINTILSKTFPDSRCPCGRIPLTGCWYRRTQPI